MSPAPVPAHVPAHVPVLLDEVVAALAPAPGRIIVDATFGAGGYARRLLDAGSTVHAFDRDPDAIAAGRGWGEAAEQPPRLVLHPRRFSEIVAALVGCGIDSVHGVVFDIGVSSMQLDQPGRGFAFALDGPLDMRMSRDGASAADFVNAAPEDEIADVLWRFGEERRSRRVARAIVAARPLATTGELARTVRRALRYQDGGHHPGAPKDPATRSFQAIRIHVNAELEELAQGLVAAEQVLAAGGRLAVVSFHSLEDRIVKQFLREAGGTPRAASRHVPAAAPAGGAAFAPTFTRISRAIRPAASEAAANPRARSATLRWAERTAAPARAITA